MLLCRVSKVNSAKQSTVVSNFTKRSTLNRSIIIPRTPSTPKEGVNWDSMTFALTNTDYMYVAEAKKDEDFNKGTLKEYGPLPLYPSATVLNYGQGIFEGIKAFRTTKDRIVVFRPEENWKRMNSGAEQFCMSKIPKDVFMEAIDTVVKANSHWVPPVDRGALYLRPLVFGDGPQLGVAPSSHYLFVVWASPVGPYFKAGKISPINLLVTSEAHRASPLGSGSVKAIGNYAPVFRVQKAAKGQGYTEVVFLDARYDNFVEEAGASNFFCVIKNELHTPSLGTILAGVTRDSVLTLARENALKVVEGKLHIDTLLSADEAFCTGTGASITPIGSVTYKGKKVVFNGGQTGRVSQQMYQILSDTHTERIHDSRNWLYDPFGSK